ncbi:putative outer membrane protein, probably involved in nutrient binding [unidentified eubacterium SCB49]|nr:putative outer membrane protein, probably involved in nutrient binding [unidentified eubacterium SCB49]
MWSFTKSQLNRNLILERSSGQKFAPLAASLLLPLTMMASTLGTTKQGGYKTKTFTSLGIGSLNKEPLRIQITVKGHITDTYGNPLNKVTIEVKETGQKTITDKKGNYQITFFDKETLLFSKDGFEIAQQKFGNYNETFNLKMTATEISITENIVSDVKKNNDNSLFISGTITDDDGLPLPGANVIIKGTSTGTQSDFDGNYSINTPKNSVLIVSYVGFNNKEITVSNIDTTFDISLESSNWLGGIIIVMGAFNNTKPTIPYFGKPEHRENTYEEDKRKAERQKRNANMLAFKKIKKARIKNERIKKRALKKRD